MVPSSKVELPGRIEDAGALMAYHNLSLTRKSLKRLIRCKLIVRRGVGFDNVDGVDARSRGIPLANVPEYGAEDVIDSAIGMALSIARGIAFLNSRCEREQGPWMYTQATPLSRRGVFTASRTQARKPRSC